MTYERHLEIARRIGPRLKERVLYVFGNVPNAGNAFARHIGVSRNTGLTMIRRYINGDLRNISPFVKAANETQRKNRLNQIVHLYDILGIKYDDPIVKDTQRINPNFVMPSDSTDSNRLDLESSLLGDIKNLEIDEIVHLKRLAEIYIRSRNNS
ncbi:MAG: hypothetical protein Q8Q42_00435 [Nanoarchaeota archaeon]|nr:hypothetical protein [Nanoarchaeota archaeon]